MHGCPIHLRLYTQYKQSLDVVTPSSTFAHVMVPAVYLLYSLFVYFTLYTETYTLKQKKPACLLTVFLWRLMCMCVCVYNLCVQHQQQVVQAVERAKQVTMAELNAIIGVSHLHSSWQHKHTPTQHTH